LAGVLHEVVLPAIKAKFNEEVDYGIGLDYGRVLVIRNGIRGTNDLSFVGTATNLSAKLSDAGHSPYHIWVSQRVHQRLSANNVTSNGKSMWDASKFEFAGKSIPVFRSNYYTKV
jgi:class 3 adenylate cyclase